MDCAEETSYFHRTIISTTTVLCKGAPPPSEIASFERCFTEHLIRYDDTTDNETPYRVRTTMNVNSDHRILSKMKTSKCQQNKSCTTTSCKLNSLNTFKEYLKKYQLDFVTIKMSVMSSSTDNRQLFHSVISAMWWWWWDSQYPTNIASSAIWWRPNSWLFKCHLIRYSERKISEKKVIYQHAVSQQRSISLENQCQ